MFWNLLAKFQLFLVYLFAMEREFAVGHQEGESDNITFIRTSELRKQYLTNLKLANALKQQISKLHYDSLPVK